MNRFFRIIFTAYVLVAAYLILSFLFGNSGILSTRDLTRYYNRLVDNITELEQNNNNLKQQIQVLKNIDNVKLKAREIGYMSEGEKKIYLSGIVNPTESLTLGRILYSNIQPADNRIIIRSLSVIFALLFYILSSIFVSERNGNKKIRL